MLISEPPGGTPVGISALLAPSSKSKAWSYHNQPDGKDEWLTPPAIIQALGPFDLDPCAPVKRPWPTANAHYTTEDNGLLKEWSGRVWCNPPYNDIEKWIARCADHGNTIAMTFARTETKWFHRHVWQRADAVAFLRGRVTFHHVDGKKAKWTGGGPSCLIAYGANNVTALSQSLLDSYVVRIGANDGAKRPEAERNK